METTRRGVSPKLLMCLLLWWIQVVSGRPWGAHEDGGSSASVFINTGQAGPGGVHITVYSFGGRLAYVREDLPVDSTMTTTTTTTASPRTPEVSIDTHQVIIAPTIPRECPEGEKPDASNECREEWFVDFGRSLKSKPDQQQQSTSGVTMTTTERSFIPKQGLGQQQQQLTTPNAILKSTAHSFKSKPGLDMQQLTTPNKLVKTTERNFKPKRGLDEKERSTPGVTVTTSQPVKVETVSAPPRTRPG